MHIVFKQNTQVNGLDSGELTSIELRDQAIRVASCLRMLGVTDLDKVGFIAENRLELAIVICGTILLGATAVPLNSAYTPRKHAINYIYTWNNALLKRACN